MVDPKRTPPTPADDTARSVLKERIQDRLTSLGLSQFEAAKLTGKDTHFIYDFFVDKKRSFKGDGMYRLAVVLHCSVDYLLGRQDEIGDPPPPRMSFNPIYKAEELPNG